MSDNRPEHHRRTVRPRWVWGGLTVALVGTVVAGWGVAVSDWWVAAVGAAIVVIGALISYRGGVMYDAGSHVDAVDELRDVVHGNVHEGVGADERLRDTAAEAIAAEAAADRRRLEQASAEHPRPGLSSLGVHLVLLASLWLLVSQALYPHTVLGQDNGLRALEFAIVAALAAFWLRQVGPSRVATLVCLLAGFGLLAEGILAPHDRTATAVSEIITGLLVAAGAAMSLDRRHGGDMTSVRGPS